MDRPTRVDVVSATKSQPSRPDDELDLDETVDEKAQRARCGLGVVGVEPDLGRDAGRPHAGGEQFVEGEDGVAVGVVGAIVAGVYFEFVDTPDQDILVGVAGMGNVIVVIVGHGKTVGFGSRSGKRPVEPVADRTAGRGVDQGAIQVEEDGADRMFHGPFLAWRMVRPIIPQSSQITPFLREISMKSP